MRTRARRSIVKNLLLALIALNLAACSDSTDAGCREGEPVTCPCENGKPGVGSCGVSECECPPAWALMAEPTSLDFGEVQPGTNVERVLLLRNLAPREVRLGAVSLLGDAAGLFSFEEPPATPPVSA